MSITNIFFLLLNLFISQPLPIKQPINVVNHNISTPKSGVQDLKVTHYDYSTKRITNMHYDKLNNIGDCKIKAAHFQILCPNIRISQFRTLHVRTYAIHAKLSDKENFFHKTSLNRGFRIDHDNWYVNNTERLFFPTEIEACRELARVGVIIKHHYHRHILGFDFFDDVRWQADIEARQGRFQLDRYKPFAFQHGSMVYNPGDNEWISNATDNP